MNGFHAEFGRAAGRRVAAAAALSVALCASAPAGAGAADQPSGWVNTFDNAAFDYWRAGALMQKASTPEELAIVTFVENTLPNLEPRALALNPDAARWLLADRPMLSALDEAGQKSYCFFAPPGPGGAGAGADAAHLRVVADLAQRALAAADAFEFVENEPATSAIYADVLRMLDRLDDDLLWVSAYQHLTLLPQVVSALEGFCAREPPRQALNALADYLAGQDRPRFPQASYLQRERETYHYWLFRDRAQAKEQLARLYGPAALQPAIDKLSTLSPEDQTERLMAWFEQYEGEMANLEAWVALPQDQALDHISDTDRRMAKLAGDPAGDGVNPLLPLLMRPFAQTYEQFLAAEATYTMMDIMVAATVQKDFTGKWPESLKDLEAFTGRTFPPDPFTGKPHRYDVRGQLPWVSTRLPGWLKRQSNLPEELALSDRLERDAQVLDQHMKMLKAERLRAAMKVRASEMDNPAKK